MVSEINKRTKLFKGNIFGKFLKIDLNSDKYSLDDLENLSFKISLSGCKIINTDFNSIKLNSIKKGVNYANQNASNLKLGTISPLISINFKLDNSIEKLINYIKFLYSAEESFDILNIIFAEKDHIFIEEFLQELSRLDNNFLYIINFNRNKLSNSSILKITNTFFQRISKNLIIEIDYIYSSNNEEDLNTDLQILSTADIIYKDLSRENQKYKRIPIILPIQNQSNIIEVANQCSIKYDGLNLKDIIFSDFDYKIENNKISIDFIKEISSDVIHTISKFLKYKDKNN
tara:strand:+ start:772 stop:1635 length:864 start_codon:yes stop_codon:yes gene_type:complete